MASDPQQVMEISLPQPDDFHHHLRDGDVLPSVMAHASRQFDRIIVMPNAKRQAHNTFLVLFIFLILQLARCEAGIPAQRYPFLYTSGTRTYQSSCQSVMVPTTAMAMKVDLFGGSGGVNNQGAKSQGGRGGGISAVLPITPGTSYWVCVGGVGTDSNPSGTCAYYGYGGWPGGAYSDCSGGGGGATTLQTSSDATAYGSRLLVAGGGGGGGYQGYNGGVGGGLIGGNAAGYPSSPRDYSFVVLTVPAKGGTQLAGGNGGGVPTSAIGVGDPGVLGVGGSDNSGGGGGGGGYYGGGGGAKSGGAGGSSYCSPDAVLLWNAQGVTYTEYKGYLGTGTRFGNGNATITFLTSYQFPNPTPAPSLVQTPAPTPLSTTQPTTKPSAAPSLEPSMPPSASPTPLVTSLPSAAPSPRPSTMPSPSPSVLPTTATPAPSAASTFIPSANPSMPPTPSRTASPTAMNTALPTAPPSAANTAGAPTFSPTLWVFSTSPTHPTAPPSAASTALAPTVEPSSMHTAAPTAAIPTSARPSAATTPHPTVQPTLRPTVLATMQPSTLPTKMVTSDQPSPHPEGLPSLAPSALATRRPSSRAPVSFAPTAAPSALSTSEQTDAPTAADTDFPTTSTTTSRPLIVGLSLTLAGLTPDADDTTRLALRQAVQLTLKLDSVALVSKPVITAVEQRRQLGATGSVHVSMQVTLPAASTYNPGNLPANAEGSLITQALDAPAASGSGSAEPALLANFASAYATAAAFTSSALPAPVLAVVSVDVTVVSQSPSAAPSPAVRLDASGSSSASSDIFSNVGVMAGVGAFLAAAVLVGAYWWCGRRNRYNSQPMTSQVRDSSRFGQASLSTTPQQPRFGQTGRQQQNNNAKQSVYVGYGEAYASQNHSQKFSGNQDLFVTDDVPAPMLRGATNASPFRSPYLAQDRL